MTFEEWLTELAAHALSSAAESRKIAADSWGSGFDTGYSDALSHVVDHLYLLRSTNDVGGARE